MHVAVLAFWNAPHGGLHEHVIAQARAIVRDGHRCTVVCKPGTVADRLATEGATVLAGDMADAEALMETFPRDVDLVHAHPGRAREVGLAIARDLGVPFILTLHGTRLDSLSTYREEVDAVVVVSEAIRDFVLVSGAFPAERVIVVPNGVDTTIFHPAADPPTPAASGARVGVATRFDRDKRFVADVIEEAWSMQLNSGLLDREWIVAGEGTVESLMPGLERVARRLDQEAGRSLVRFSGWIDQEGLAQLFRDCHVVVASGRGAAEAMACGTPTIAIGSRGYLGIMDEERAWAGRYGNFGGLGEQLQSYPAGALERDLERLLADPQARTRIGAFAARFAAAHFSQERLDRSLLSVYESLSASPKRSSAALDAPRLPRTPVDARMGELRAALRTERARAARLERARHRDRERIEKLGRRLAAVSRSRLWRTAVRVRRLGRALIRRRGVPSVTGSGDVQRTGSAPPEEPL